MEQIHMTYYDWIRACLLEDAKAHPFPGQGFRLSAVLAKAEDSERSEETTDDDSG